MTEPESVKDPAPADSPLYAGLVHGVRIWRVVPDPRHGRPLLAAAAKGVVWPPGEAVRGTCVGGGHRNRPHLPPHRACTCGIYAHHPRTRTGTHNLERVLASDRLQVAGVVSAWGRLEVHLDGFRAELAAPDTLLYRSPASEQLVTELADRYGAKLVEVPDVAALREFIGTLNGIPLTQVNQHVAAGLEIELVPDASASVGENGEHVVSSGFSVEEDSDILNPDFIRRIQGLEVFHVAGVSHRKDALQAVEFSPGSAVRLIPEPNNRYDEHAVGVWDVTGEAQVGYVPRSAARRVGVALAKERIRTALVLCQYRGMATGERSGIKVLTAPTDHVRFVQAGREGRIVVDAKAASF